jgi:hypothetical protein
MNIHLVKRERVFAYESPVYGEEFALRHYDDPEQGEHVRPCDIRFKCEARITLTERSTLPNEHGRRPFWYRTVLKYQAFEHHAILKRPIEEGLGLSSWRSVHRCMLEDTLKDAFPHHNASLIARVSFTQPAVETEDPSGLFLSRTYNFARRVIKDTKRQL